MHRQIVAAFAAAVALTGTDARASLTAVTENGDHLVSDSTLNVTWADVASPTHLIWSAAAAPGSAQAWIHSLNASDYGGFNDWTLPTGDGSVTSSAANYSTANQLAYLFITELGNTAGQQATHLGPFSTLSNNAVYLSGSQGPASPSGPAYWNFDTLYDTAFSRPNSDSAPTWMALAVRAGQVSEVPVPPSAWLLGSGVVALLTLNRRPKPA